MLTALHSDRIGKLVPQALPKKHHQGSQEHSNRFHFLIEIL